MGYLIKKKHFSNARKVVNVLTMGWRYRKLQLKNQDCWKKVSHKVHGTAASKSIKSPFNFWKKNSFLYLVSLRFLADKPIHWKFKEGLWKSYFHVNDCLLNQNMYSWMHSNSKFFSFYYNKYITCVCSRRHSLRKTIVCVSSEIKSRLDFMATFREWRNFFLWILPYFLFQI